MSEIGQFDWAANTARIQQTYPGLRRWVEIIGTYGGLWFQVFDREQGDEPTTVFHMRREDVGRVAVLQHSLGMAFPAMTLAEHVRMHESGEVPEGVILVPAPAEAGRP